MGTRSAYSATLMILASAFALPIRSDAFAEAATSGSSRARASRHIEPAWPAPSRQPEKNAAEVTQDAGRAAMRYARAASILRRRRYF